MKKVLFPKTLLALFLVLLPVLSVTGSVILVIKEHEIIKASEATYRAEEVAQFEMKRFSSMLNLRLNFLREELYHLYLEMLNVVPPGANIKDDSKQKVLFSRRDYLHSYAVLKAIGLTPRGQPAFDVFRYQFRPGGIPNFGFENVNHMLDYYKEQSQKVTTSNYVMQPVNGNFEWFFISLPMKDESGKDIIFAGIFNRSYIFTFCRGFNDIFGKINTNALVVTDAGQVVCHSHERFEKQNFVDTPFFKNIQGALSKGGAAQTATTFTAKYQNVASEPVVAAIKKFNGFIFITEAYDISPWVMPVPMNRLSMMLTIVIVLTIAAVVLLAYMTGGFALNTQKESFKSEVKKLKDEVDELKESITELHSSREVVGAFHNLLSEKRTAKDLISIFLETLSGASGVDIKYKAGLFLYDESKKRMQGITSSTNWDPGLIRDKSFDYEAAPTKFKDYDRIIAILSPRLKEELLRIEPIEFSSKLVGLVVLVSENQNEPVVLDKETLSNLIQGFSSAYMALRLNPGLESSTTT